MQASPALKRGNTDKPVEYTIASVQYKKEESKGPQIYRHKEIKTVDDNELDRDWQTTSILVHRTPKVVRHLGQAFRTSGNVGRTFRPH